MIADKLLAQMVSKRILDANRLLNEAMSLVAESASIDETRDFRLAIGQVSGELLLMIANPLYREHPELKPQELFIPQLDTSSQ